MNSKEIFIKLIYAIFFTIYALLFFYIISEIIGPLNYSIFFLPFFISLSVCLLFKKNLKKLKNFNDFCLFTVSKYLFIIMRLPYFLFLSSYLLRLYSKRS